MVSLVEVGCLSLSHNTIPYSDTQMIHKTQNRTKSTNERLSKAQRMNTKKNQCFLNPIPG